ncbi:OmpA family protein [Sinorhizobium sp. RAC02]|uniref:OmpA family protein n=1 Tax=Sinorhizobium sp. RAC02 TaxID=1842534 RepID=UPI00083D6DB2|nr:OmpA family protein [Sinorhizobium sp. RAC02]AOF91570.1 ompA family protein [Sinorhizobium sp. RAC02]
MGKRTTLLATVALPLASLVWQPVEAAVMRPAFVSEGVPHVITVQSEGDLSEEELRRQRRERKQAREEQQGDEGQQQDRQKAREERRQKQREAEGEQQQQGDRQKAREERRQKQREAEGEQQQQEERLKAREERRQKQREAEGEQQQQQDRQKAREERRQKQREAEGEQQQQEERQKAREERRQKQREAEGEQQQQEERLKAREERRQKQREAEGEQQQQQDRQKAREERRQKQREAEGEQQQQDERLKAREERRQKQREAEGEQQQQEERLKAREERRQKQREAEVDEQQQEAREKVREERRRKRDEGRERIARDPSKTTDTIELPFIDGAAVLDSDKESDNRRDSSREERRRKRAEERRNADVRVPESDRDAQIGWKDRDRVEYEPAERERGERRDRRPRYADRDGWRVEREVEDRFVINFGDRVIVRSDDGGRLSRRAAETYFEDLPNGRVREVIIRPNGDRVVTIRNRYGEVIQRSRINSAGREYVMFYAPEIDRDSRPTFVDPGERLPPMRLTIPVDDYIIDTSAEDRHDYREFLDRPPVEPVERVYTLDEVKYSARIRDKVRRIDLDTITFATGSSEISMNQASSLRKVADAINEILDKDPGETFLIEGHTDAVGSDESNLVLSDERAEAVANVLTDVYDIAPENLATQGYGERYLKIETESAEQLNRRVTIRRVTPLVKPVAMAE